MGRAPRPWFRFYVETFADPKIRRFRPSERWLWAAVLGVARQSPVPGSLYVSLGEPMTTAELADWAGMRTREVAPTMERFAEVGMVSLDQSGAWFVTAWDTRQFESDDVTARTRQHRARERSIAVSGNGPEQKKKQRQITPPSPPPRADLPDWMRDRKHAT